MKIYLCYVVAAVVLALSSSPVSAGTLDCSGCHARTGTGDLRPLDSAYRNISSGAFSGNHQTHMSPAATPDTCSACHNNEAFKTDHRDKKIQIAWKIGNYSGAFGRARYTTTRPTAVVNGSVFFNQTSVPVLATCSRVSCHFETTTPVWGTDAATSGTGCASCHGNPPDGTSSNNYAGGSDGSHSKHSRIYSTACSKCHTDHTADSQPFAHATSIGRRDLAVRPVVPGNVGRYNSVDRNYLPGQAASHSFGTCSNTYCHSPGIKAPAAAMDQPNSITTTWGGTLACDGCHKASPLTGSHVAHVATTYGVPVACYKCHAATVTPATEISSTAHHVNIRVDVAFNSTTTATFGKYSGHLTPMQKTPGSGYANCENVYCHSSGQGSGGSWPPTYSAPKWSVSATGKCGTCHNHGLHGGAALSSGSHTKHLGYDFGNASHDATLCGVCHYGTGFTSTSCTQCHFGSDALTTQHVNHEVDVSFVGKFGGVYNGTVKPGDGYSTCSSTYCHSNGTRKNPPYISNSSAPAWGNASSVVCGSCHKATPGTGFAVISSSGHTAHLTKSTGPKLGTAITACQACHPYSATTHVNKLVEKKPCTPCHPGTEPTWTSKQLACEDCHGKNATVSVMNNMSAPNTWTYYTAPRGSNGGGGHNLTCSNCHGSHTDPYAFDIGQHISGVRGDWQGLNRTLDGSAPYIMNPATWGNSLPDNSNCDVCHSALAMGEKKTHVRSRGEGENASMSCVACHDTHGAGNLHMIRSRIWFSPSQPPAAIRFTNVSTFVQYEAPYQGLCQVCHTLTGHFKRGVAEPGGAGQHGSPAYRKCTSCHDHGTKLGAGDFKVSYAFQPAGCDGCHGYPPVSSTAVYGTHDKYTSARLQNYSGGGGAHTAKGHLASTIKATDGNPWQACQLCHSAGEAGHTKNITAFSPANSTQQRKGNVSVAVKSRNRLSNNRLPGYRPDSGADPGNTASCWNVNCHFQPTPRWGKDK